MAKAYLYDLTDTWNAGGTTFTAIKMNATDTASAAGSMLIDLQVGGTTQFHVLKSGAVHTKRSNYNITNTNAASILVSNYSLTGSDATSMFDLAGTWNTSGTPTAIKLNVTDTASAAGSLLLDLQVGGSSKFSVSKGGVVSFTGVNNPSGAYYTQYSSSGHQFGGHAAIGGGGSFGGDSAINLGANFSLSWSSTAYNPALAPDLQLYRDAANTLAQRNSTNAQAFRVYNTYTDASNYERGFFRFNTNVLRIGFETAGTGSTRAMQLMSVGFAFFGINDTNAIWNINGSGHFIAGTDNSVDIGATGANRPRNVHIAGYVSIGDGITAPGAGTGQARIYVDTADGDLKVVFADGTIKTIVTDT